VVREERHGVGEEDVGARGHVEGEEAFFVAEDGGH